MRRSVPAKGFTEPAVRRQRQTMIMARFDPETFEEITALATSSGTSTAEAIRTLVEWGIESAKQAA